MSLKAIELQVALPRTQSVGKIQDQLQQRGQVVQDHLGIEQKKAEEKQRKQVLKTSKTEKKRINNDDGDHSRDNTKNKGQNTGQRQEVKQKPNVAKHPYKGNNVDYSG